MRLIEINEAEAILEPFFDGGTSDRDDTDPRYRVLDEYTVTPLNGAIASVTQNWCSAFVQVTKTVPNAPVLRMERECRVDIHDYDTFILFGSIPTDMSFDAEAVIDGNRVTLGLGIQGVGQTEEFPMPLSGRMMTGLTLTFYARGEGIQADLNWLGAAHSGRLERMLARKNQYTPDWPGFFAETKPENPKPEIGIWFGAEELADLREKMKKAPFDRIYQEKKEKAEQDMAIVPEEYIGRFVPYYDRRWCRTRDREHALDRTWKTSSMQSVAENLAFVGLIENDREMLRMACRHAISFAHCEYWTESAMGILPGAVWHHRSFTENGFCRVVALILDWCGELLTPFGKGVLRDALALKGLPQLESDFRRFEYIRKMNQGIVFSQGRIFAQLALSRRYPRYAQDLERSEQELIEMIGNYVNDDGGTPEGPGYWMFTFNECVSAFYALARYHKKPFTQYRDVFGRTGRYELAMLSMEDDRTVLHAINDAHPGVHVSCTLASAFYQFTGDAAWKNLYERLMAKNLVDEDTFSLISAPLSDGVMLPEPELDRFFPITGQMGILRQGQDLETRIQLISGATCNTHFDEDRGSIVLEADGHILCPDCGCPNYCETELMQLHNAQFHSLLCPVREDGIRTVQGMYEPGGKVFDFKREGAFAEFTSDDTLAWSDGVYEQVGRRVTSPAAELVVLEDTFRLGNADYVIFQLNSYGKWQIEEGMAKNQVGNVTLRVAPLNWKWEEAGIHQTMDGEHRPVYQLRASCKEKKAGRLLTAVCMEKSMTIAAEKTRNGWRFTQGEKTFQLEEGEESCRWQNIQA